MCLYIRSKISFLVELCCHLSKDRFRTYVTFVERSFSYISYICYICRKIVFVPFVRMLHLSKDRFRNFRTCYICRRSFSYLSYICYICGKVVFIPFVHMLHLLKDRFRNFRTYVTFVEGSFSYLSYVCYICRKIVFLRWPVWNSFFHWPRYCILFPLSESPSKLTCSVTIYKLLFVTAVSIAFIRKCTFFVFVLFFTHGSLYTLRMRIVFVSLLFLYVTTWWRIE